MKWRKRRPHNQDLNYLNDAVKELNRQQRVKYWTDYTQQIECYYRQHYKLKPGRLLEAKNHAYEQAKKIK